MIDSTYDFYTDVDFAVPVVSVTVVHEPGNIGMDGLLRLALAQSSNSSDPLMPRFRCVVTTPTSPVSNADLGQLEEYGVSAVAHVAVQPLLAHARHVVSVIGHEPGSSGVGPRGAASLSAQHTLRSSLVSELENCPVPLRSGQQVAAFFLLRCKLYLAPPHLAALMNHVAWLGDYSTLAALVTHVMALHDVAPRSFSAVPPPPSQITAVRTLRRQSNTTSPSDSGGLRDVVSISLEATGVPSSQRPISVLVITPHSFAPQVRMAALHVPHSSSKGETTTSALSSSSSTIEPRDVVLTVMEKLRPSDSIAVICGGSFVVQPSLRENARMVAMDEDSSAASAVRRAGNVGDAMCAKLTSVLKQWRDDERRLRIQQRDSEPQQQQPRSAADVLVLYVRNSDEDLVTEGSGVDDKLASIVRRNPLFRSVTLCALLLQPTRTSHATEALSVSVATNPTAAATAAVNPMSVFAATCEGLGSFHTVQDIAQAGAEVATLIERHRLMCLQNAHLLFCGPPRSLVPSLRSSSVTYGVKELGKVNARLLTMGRMSTKDVAHAVFDMASDDAIRHGVFILLSERSAAYGSVSDVKILFPTRFACVDDGSSSVAESWWQTVNALRSATLRPPTAALPPTVDTAWSAIRGTVQAHAPQLYQRITNELRTAPSLKFFTARLLAQLSSLLLLRAPAVAASSSSCSAMSTPPGPTKSLLERAELPQSGGAPDGPRAHDMQALVHPRTQSPIPVMVAAPLRSPRSRSPVAVVSKPRDASSHRDPSGRRPVSRSSSSSSSSDYYERSPPEPSVVVTGRVRRNEETSVTSVAAAEHEVPLSTRSGGNSRPTQVVHDHAGPRRESNEPAGRHRGTVVEAAEEQLRASSMTAQLVESTIQPLPVVGGNTSSGNHTDGRSTALSAASFFNEAAREHVMADPRWTSLEPSEGHAAARGASSLSWTQPSASSLESAMVRVLPSGAVSHKSYSVSLQSLQGGAAYLEFPPLRPLVKHGVKLAARALILCEVDTAAKTLDIVKSVKLPNAVSGVQAPTEHVFYELKRGTTYCVVHLASLKPPEEWITFADLALADGIEFSTPEYMVDGLRVTDVYARSVALEWEGNATAYILTVQKIVEGSATVGGAKRKRGAASGAWATTSLNTSSTRGASRIEADDDDDDGPSMATTYHCSTPNFALVGLSPSSIYHVVVAPSLMVGPDVRPNQICVESSEHIVATAAEPDPQALTVQAVPLRSDDDSAADTSNLMAGGVNGGDANANVDRQRDLRVAVSLSYPSTTVVQKEYVLAIEPLLSVDGLFPSANTATVTAIPGRTMDVTIEFDVVVSNRSTNVVLLQKRSHLTLRTTIGPFDMVFGVQAANVTSTTADIAWTGTGEDHLVEVISERQAAGGQQDGGDEEEDSEQCHAVGRNVRNLTVDGLRPSTLYYVRVKGKRAVNSVTTTFRTSPPKPLLKSIVVAHSLARRELVITVPPRSDVRGTVTEHKAVVQPFGEVLLSSESKSETFVVDIPLHQSTRTPELKTAEGASFLPPHVFLSQVVRVLDEAPMESEPMLISVVSSVSALLDAATATIRWFAVCGRDDGGVRDVSSFVGDHQRRSPNRRSTVAAAARPSQAHPFQVTVGSQFQTVWGTTAAFSLSALADRLVHPVNISGATVAQEMSPCYLLVPPPPPAASLVQSTVFEDHAVFALSEKFNGLLEEIPVAIRQEVEVLLEFRSACFPSVYAQVPVTELVRVHVPLLLNRLPNAAVELRIVVRVKQDQDGAGSAAALTAGRDDDKSTGGSVRPDAAVFLNPIVVSGDTLLPTPIVYAITNVEVVELQSRQATLRWFSDNPSHEITLIAGGADGSAASRSVCRSSRPIVVLENLNPETCYHVEIRGSQSGGHVGVAYFVTPPTLTTSFVADVAATIRMDGWCLVFDLPPTRCVPTSVPGGSGVIKTQTFARLHGLFQPSPPSTRPAGVGTGSAGGVEKGDRQLVVWSSAESGISTCTAVLPSTLTYGQRWPHLTVESVSDCVASEVVGGTRLKNIVSLSSRAQDRQVHRIDLVGGLVLESLTPEHCVISWLGSAASYSVTVRSSCVALDENSVEEPPRDDADAPDATSWRRFGAEGNRGNSATLLGAPVTYRTTTSRCTLDFRGEHSEVLFISIRGEDGVLSNEVRASIVVPPQQLRARILALTPNSLTFRLSRPKKSVFLVTSCYATVDGTKVAYSNTSTHDEEFTVQLEAKKMVIRGPRGSEAVGELADARGSRRDRVSRHDKHDRHQARSRRHDANAATLATRSGTTKGGVVAGDDREDDEIRLASSAVITPEGVTLVVHNEATLRPIVKDPAQKGAQHPDSFSHATNMLLRSSDVIAETVTALLQTHQCLNSTSTTSWTYPLPLLHTLTDLRVVSVDSSTAELRWMSHDSEFYVDIFQFHPSASSSSQITDGSDAQSPHDDDNSSPDAERGGGRRTTATALVRWRNETTQGARDSSLPSADLSPSRAAASPPGQPSETRDDESSSLLERSLSSALRRSVVVSTASLKLRQLQSGMLHLVRVRGRQCGDVTLEVAFLTQPLFAERSVVLRRHAEGNLLTVSVEDPLVELWCGDAKLSSVTTVALVDADGNASETIKFPGNSRSVSVNLVAPSSLVKVVRTLSCEWEGRPVVNNHLATELQLARVPRMPTLSKLDVSKVEPNQIWIRWECNAVDAPQAMSFAGGIRFVVVAAAVASLNGGQVHTHLPKRSVQSQHTEVNLASLQPATLYELSVAVDVSYKLQANQATRALTVHDDSADRPTISTYVITPPKRAAAGSITRYLGGYTVHLDPHRYVHEPTGLTMFYAARTIPDNHIITCTMPCSTERVAIPPPTLPVRGALVFLTAVPQATNPGELFTCDVAVTEPAGRETHRVEWFQVVEVSDRSPYRVNVVNPLQFSDPEFQPIDMVRVISKPVVTHVTSRRATIAWQGSHEEMRCDVTLSDVMHADLPPTVHRVVEPEIALEQLNPATAYEVHVTPSYRDTPCEPLNFLFLTAPRRPKPPKIHVLLLNAVFDLPATQRTEHPGPSASGGIVSITHTALVLCTQEVSDLTKCTTATDYLEQAQARNVFRSADTPQRIDLRLRSGKAYVLVFFTSIHHPMAINGILHSKPCVVPHRTDCYPPSNVHVISRTKTSITVGWSSVDVGSKLLRFLVEMAPLQERVTALTPRSTNAGSDMMRIGRQPAMSVTMSNLYGDEAVSAMAAVGGGRSGRFKSLSIRQQMSHAAERAAGEPSPDDPLAGLTPQQRLEAAFDAPPPGEPDQRHQQVVETSASRPEMHATFSFLKSGVQYAFRVCQMANEAPHEPQAVSAFSAILVAETAAPPKPVEKLQVVGVTSTAVRLAWVDRQATDVDHMAYQVEWRCTERAPNSSGTAAKRVQDLVVHTTQCEIQGLHPGLQYRITVTPINASGESCTHDNAVIQVRTETPQNWRF